MAKIAKNIFLAIPASQPILFLDKNEREMLFQDRFDDYQASLKKTKNSLYGFFTYSFLPVDLIQSFFDYPFAVRFQ